MKKTSKRNLSILYKMVLDAFKKENVIYGICSTILQLQYTDKISLYEYQELKNNLKVELSDYYIPAKFKQHSSFLGENALDFYWERNSEGYMQRILFLEHLIKKSSS